jgi:oligoribonuclease NrnB/cAMP/cGMP phosphodiesterase (DHH superfamily)
MAALSKPEVICTHESDLDGLVSGMLLRRLALKLFGADPQLQAWNYQGWRIRQLSEHAAWVSDFTYEPRLNKTGWVLFDHHTASPVPRPEELRVDYRFDAGKSASLIAYDTCRAHGIASPELDRIVRLTDIGDLWRSTEPEFELAADYANLVKTYGFWNLYKLVDGEPERLLDHPLLEVIAVKRRVEDPIGLAWASQHVEEINDDVAVVHLTVGNTNLVVHQMLERRVTRHKVLVTFFPKANRTVVVSFRSLSGEALAVASKLDGGGHPNAAGATLPKSVGDIDAAVAYLRQNLGPSPKVNTAFAALDQLKL